MAREVQFYVGTAVTAGVEVGTGADETGIEMPNGELQAVESEWSTSQPSMVVGHKLTLGVAIPLNPLNQSHYSTLWDLRAEVGWSIPISGDIPQRYPAPGIGLSQDMGPLTLTEHVAWAPTTHSLAGVAGRVGVELALTEHVDLTAGLSYAYNRGPSHVSRSHVSRSDDAPGVGSPHSDDRTDVPMNGESVGYPEQPPTGYYPPEYHNARGVLHVIDVREDRHVIGAELGLRVYF